MEHSKPTQNQRILDYMDENGSITALEAMQNIGVMRLASRISEIKKRGYPIKSRIEKVKNRYGEESRVKRYFVADEN